MEKLNCIKVSQYYCLYLNINLNQQMIYSVCLILAFLNFYLGMICLRGLEILDLSINIPTKKIYTVN